VWLKNSGNTSSTVQVQQQPQDEQQDQRLAEQEGAGLASSTRCFQIWATGVMIMARTAMMDDDGGGGGASQVAAQQLGSQQDDVQRPRPASPAEAIAMVFSAQNSNGSSSGGSRGPSSSKLGFNSSSRSSNATKWHLMLLQLFSGLLGESSC